MNPKSNKPIMEIVWSSTRVCRSFSVGGDYNSVTLTNNYVTPKRPRASTFAGDNDISYYKLKREEYNHVKQSQINTGI